MSSVSLTIRTPTLNAGDDVTLSCHMDWSVLKVKQEIEKQFESHPRPEDQRLVYSGKLLDNNSVLEHVLRFDDEVTSYTVHLVCR
jgi:homocysteine-responsive ER-resident protein 1 with ubiquitin-like domain